MQDDKQKEILKKLDFKSGINAADKCISLSNDVINSKDYEKMGALMKSDEYTDNFRIVNMVPMTNVKYQPAGALIRKIMTNDYTGVVDTFKSLDPECRVLVAKTFETNMLQQYLVYLSQNQGKNMEMIDITFKPMSELLAKLNEEFIVVEPLDLK